MTAQKEPRPIGGGVPGPWTVVAASFAFGLVALLVTLRFPVFFHWDDVTYLRWAQTNPSLQALFDPSRSTLFGTYRPALLLTWWCLFRLFGLQAPFYQFFLTFLYGLAFGSFLLLLQRLYGRRTALLGLLGYLVVFFPLGYIIFWFSDLTFIQELFFVSLSLWCFHTLYTGARPLHGWGFLCYLGAILTKEPSALIVTSVLLVYAWARWPALPPESRRRLAWVLPVVALTGLLWLALGPGVRSRQGITEAADVTEAFRFAAERWHFYAATLQAQAGSLLWVGVLFLGARSLLPRAAGRGRLAAILLLVLAGALSLILKRFPSAALLALLAACLPCILRRRDVAVGVVWGFVPFAGLLSLGYYTRTYLVESSFGMAALLAVAGDHVLQPFDGLWRTRAGRLTGVAAAVLVLVALVPLSGMARGKLAALQILSDNRRNFGDVSDYLRRNPLPQGARVAVVTYRDMGLSYRDGVERLADEQKGGLQKTMESANLPDWFRLIGRPDLGVIPSMKDYLLAPPDSCYVWVMNAHEKRYVDGLPLTRELLYEVHRRGQGAWFYLARR